MKAIEQEQFDTNLYQQNAHLEQLMIMKTNLKKILSSDEFIENVNKSFRDAAKIFILTNILQQLKEKN